MTNRIALLFAVALCLGHATSQYDDFEYGYDEYYDDYNYGNWYNEDYDEDVVGYYDDEEYGYGPDDFDEYGYEYNGLYDYPEDYYMDYDYFDQDPDCEVDDNGKVQLLGMNPDIPDYLNHFVGEMNGLILLADMQEFQPVILRLRVLTKFLISLTRGWMDYTR